MSCPEETGQEVVFPPMEPRCVGCEHMDMVKDGCKVYRYPILQHSRIGGCPMRTHNRKVNAKEEFKLNPLKASKRGAKQ